MQSGVVSRRQLLATGWVEHDIRRALRRRDLAVLHPGAYINHTGPPSWIQRAWGALLVVAATVDVDDVALSHESALRVAEGPGRRYRPEGSIHVAVRPGRRLHPPPGIVLHRCGHFDARVVATKYPPRIRYEEAIVDVASQSSRLDAVALLGRVVGDRRTTATRLLASLEQRSRISQRAWLAEVLTDVAHGTHSVLEHGFLAEVTRPHGLPDPRRQLREVTAVGVAYRDARYGDVVVELDGRLFHSSFEQRDADMDRDLVVAVSGGRTVRLGWGQVFARPCWTAETLGPVLTRGRVRPCGPACAVGRSTAKC